MERDALEAGVSEIGGLFSTADIRILICYIISAVNEPVPGRLLAEALHYEGIANCFEVNDSIAALVKNGQLLPVDEAEDTYIATDSGRDVAETLKTSISYSVKERAYAAALKMLARFKNAKETDFKITNEDGRAFITCTAIDNGRPFMSVKLLAGDEEQALFIKERFLSDSSIYAEIIELLTKRKEK